MKRNGDRGFNAEKICARDEVVGLPEQSEPEGPQGAASGGEAEKESSSESHNFVNVSCDHSNLQARSSCGLGAKIEKSDPNEE